MTLGRNTIMSLSRRNAASESAKKAVARGSCFVARKSSPSFRMGCGQISQRAALRDGPYELRTTNHESQKSTSRRPTSPAESRVSLSGLYTFTPSGHEIRHKRLTRFCASQSSFKPGSLLIPGNPGRIESRSFPTNHEPLTTNNKKSTSIS